MGVFISQSRENWIRMKYLDKTFVKPLIKPFLLKCNQYKNSNRNAVEEIIIENENQLLHYASFFSDLKLIIYAIALNADLNFVDADNYDQTPLIKAVLSVNKKFKKKKNYKS